MNRLPSSTSFQGVLDSIIRNYLLNELPPEGAENSNARQLVAEKDLGFLQASGLQLQNTQDSTANFQNPGEVNNNAGPRPGTSTGNNGVQANTFTSANPSDHEYIKAVYQCFEKRGVFKELQTFLRHKLVSILQEEWPNLQKPVAASQKEGPNTVVYKLVDDFLRCHKLLYTLSVLASESDVKPQSNRVLYGKLSSKEAEDLLDEMGIKHHSRLSGQILKCYFDKDNFSLLESMQYLGIWLDDSSLQLDNLQQENDATSQERRRRSSGESIVLSRRGKEKAEKSPLPENRKGKEERENAVGIEKRLLELEKNLEKEKEFKINQAIEKYKSEEQVRLREELETKFKLQLVEKEREHFLDIQKRMGEMNAAMQQERQQWLEVKLRQEKDLLECKKQLNEMMNASGDHAWKSSTRPFTNGSQDACHPARKATNGTATKIHINRQEDSSPEYVHKCSCRKRSASCQCTGGESLPVHRHPAINSIEQDRLAFLQYRMEQQDEEVKSLRRQLLFSNQALISKSKPVARHDSDSELNEASGHQRALAGSNTTSPRSDDLAAFLSESRARVEKLDTAVDKVDEIVQELFSKRRSPLSKELSSRLLSASVNKNQKPALSQLYSSLQSMATATTQNVPLLSPMNTFPSVVPLIHQQIPEKQPASSSSLLLQNLPSFKYTAGFPENSLSETPVAPMKYYPSPPLTRNLVGLSKNTRRDDDMSNRPHTPVERMFEVAYGPPQTTQPPKPSSKHSSNESSPAAGVVALNVDDTVKKPEPEESLFHMAIRQDDEDHETSINGSREKVKATLEEKAIRNGALSREKILSSDEGEHENSFSASISLPGSLKQTKVTKPILKTTFGNGVLKPVAVNAISKSKVPESFDKPDKIPLRVVSGNSGAKQQSLYSQQLIKSKSNSPVSSSSSSSRKLKFGTVSKVQSRSHSRSEVQGRSSPDNDEQSSLSISVAKSLDADDNNEDFWQL